MHFDNYGSLHAAVPGILVSLVVYVELGQEGLGIDLFLDGQQASLEVLGGGKLPISVSLAWWLSDSCDA